MVEVVQLLLLDLPEMMPPLLKVLPRFGLAAFETALAEALEPFARIIGGNDRKAQTYQGTLKGLPVVDPVEVALDCDRIRIGQAGDLRRENRQILLDALRTLTPWRKGPFDVFGIHVDSEWESYLKWNRIRPHVAPLQDLRILDIGSSCGYYMFRMCPAEPALILGIEPYLTFYFQFELLQRYIAADHAFTLPIRLEALPPMPGFFDTVFCMGILYHQRNPCQSLKKIKSLLRPGGQLVLETLILENDGDAVLNPPGRYAKMNNVYTIPSVTRLRKWLVATGYEEIRCVDVTPTTLAEQRPTEWINTESLDAFLDPDDPGLTIEGHPAPVRAVVLANA